MRVFLYLFRHGQTDMNIARRYQGQLLNEKLNAEGVKQAKELAASFADCPLEIIYSSPLRRAAPMKRRAFCKTAAVCLCGWRMI